jgi:hypothetical protein
VKKLVLTALALGAMSGVAAAAPTKLSETQLDQVAAGDLNTIGGITLVLNIPVAVAPTICVRAICNGTGASIDQSLNNVNFIVNSNLVRVHLLQQR